MPANHCQMTYEQLKRGLATDPNFIFSFIYANNPDAVISNLRALGFPVENADDVFNAINQLHEQGETDKIASAFAVPILTDEMDPGTLAVIQEVASSQVALANGKMQRKLDWDSATWAVVAGAAVSLIGAFTGKPAVQQSNAANTPPPPAKKDNTGLYLAIGGGVLLLIIILILVLRKK